MMDDRQERRLEGVERLLREQGPAEFSADFRSGILSAIEKLPDPELLPPPAAQRGQGRARTGRDEAGWTHTVCW